jgi:TRAP-type C4-dicarboxylate transport system permease small subunit
MHVDQGAEDKSGSGPITVIMNACGWVGAILIGLMALLVGADICLRALGQGNLAWANEVIEYMITGATFIGAPWVLHHHGHVNIDIVVAHLPARTRRWVEFLGNVVCLLVSAVMLYQSVQVVLDTRESGALVFKTLVFPEWYLITPVVLCFGLFVFEFVHRLWRTKGL